MKKLFIPVVLFLAAFTTNAQTTVRGKIQSADGAETSQAVSLLSTVDSVVMKLALTDSTGNYVFHAVEPGSYFIKASGPENKPAYSKNFEASEKMPNLFVENLKTYVDAKELQALVVNSKKPFIERQIDKTVMNVDASVTNAGTTALEMLEKAPGVMVDQNGNITLQGKSGVQITIDGKPTYMSGTDLINYLKNLPSSTLETVELMTNPSAKHDASGTAGIINIKTKKSKVRGFNGNLSTSYGRGKYGRTNNSLNLNFRRNKVNVFANAGFSYRRNYNDLFLKRDYFNSLGDTYAKFDQVNRRISEGEGYSGKLGMDYYLSNKTTVGIVGRFNEYSRNADGINSARIFDGNGTLDSLMESNTEETNKWRSRGLNLNFRHQFDSTGRELTADADYIVYPNRATQSISNNTFFEDGTLKTHTSLMGLLPSGINIYSFKSDYTQKIFKDAKLETGVKFSKVNTENIAGYYMINGGGKVPDYNKSNNFDYTEQIAAAYINMNKQIKKLGVQAGLRLENTNYTGLVYGNPTKADSSFEKTYTSLFPTLYLSYNLSEKNTMGLTMGRRISRPNYESLNPFLSYLDPYTLSSGNPYLLPAYTNQVQLNYSYNKWLTIQANYSHDKNLISGLFEQQGLVTIQKQGNFGYKNNWGANVSAQVPVKKWWSMNLYAESNLQHFHTILNGQVVDLKINNAMVQGQNAFTFKKNWSAELSGFWGTGFNEGQLIINPMWSLNAGVAKKIMKSKGALKLNVRDIFNTSNGSGYGDFQTAYARFHQNQDRRAVTMTFTYNFGKPFKASPKRNTGAASEEQNRVRSGE